MRCFHEAGHPRLLIDDVGVCSGSLLNVGQHAAKREPDAESSRVLRDYRSTLADFQDEGTGARFSSAER